MKYYWILFEITGNKKEIFVSKNPFEAMKIIKGVFKNNTITLLNYKEISKEEASIGLGHIEFERIVEEGIVND